MVSCTVTTPRSAWFALSFPATSACEIIMQVQTHGACQRHRGQIRVVDQCGVCFGGGASCPYSGTSGTCSLTGHMLIESFDGNSVNFVGTCDYVLAKSTVTKVEVVDAVNVDPFEVLARYGIQIHQLL